MIHNFESFDQLTNAIQNPVRQLKADVLFESPTSTYRATHNDFLKEFTVERIGDDSKFFGFGVCQKINVKLINRTNDINVTTAHSITVAMGEQSIDEMIVCFPQFYVTEVHKDEQNKQLSITAYDKLYKASQYFTADLGIGGAQTYSLGSAYTIRDVAIAVAEFLGVSIAIPEISSFNIFYEEGANYEGSELIRDVLDDIAEATQTIYYMNNENTLVFKRLFKAPSVEEEVYASYTIDSEQYYNLESKTNRRLTGICHVTELGDNVIAQTQQTGTIQYVRDNPFWDLREDIDEILEEALADVEGTTINQFECNWRGNFLLEIGDMIFLFDSLRGDYFSSYLLNDTFEYNGAMQQNSKWHYSGDNETETNPSSLGDILKQTFAKVDKINKQIDIVVSHVQQNQNSIAQIQLDAESIKMSVKETEKKVDDAIDSTNKQIAELTKKVSASITSDDLKIEIEKQLQESGSVNKVVTTTGFTFNEDGLNISKSGSEMTTIITEDGMTVYRDNTAMLIANNQGVDALNLRATSYLIIGTNSRFEDYGYNRTGCFWIGGN